MARQTARRTARRAGQRHDGSGRCLRNIAGGIAIAGTLVLAGCTGSQSDEPAAAQPTASNHTAVTDVETCDAFGDVLTIAFNADLGVRQERMSSQEQDGWYQLASRVLDRVPARGEGAVSDALAALQAVSPAVPLGAASHSQIGSDEWTEALTDLMTACDDAGAAVVTLSFTGG